VRLSFLASLLTPSEVAIRQRVRESWLRKEAAARPSRARSWASTCGSPRLIWPPSSPGPRCPPVPAGAATSNRIDRRFDQILVVTAAYTGMRSGELAGLARANIRLGDGLIRIDPKVGALHEVQGRFYLGPPKTASSARDVHLPPFLIHLLHEQ
jgi:integrase